MADNPVWVIPAITASASLLGTIVGGLVAYWTSKRMHERTTEVIRRVLREATGHQRLEDRFLGS